MASPLSHLIHADPLPLPGPSPPLTSGVGPNTASPGANVGRVPPGHHPMGPYSLPLGASRPYTPASATAIPTSSPAHPNVGMGGGSTGPTHSPGPGNGSTSSPTPDSQAKGHIKNASLYMCAHCHKSYSRPEHLQRHIATHTLGKRFICDVCGKAFGRADLLKRHRANHDDHENGVKKRRINTAPGAGRVAHACQACARARVKCEESKPCTRCRTRNVACEYGSAEAGSAAAMHLLHLSSGAGANSSVSPDSQSSYNNDAGSNPGSITAQSSAASDAAAARSLAVTSEEVQLPITPDTMMETNHQSSDGYSTQPYVGNTSMPVDMRFPFTDFMNNVLYDELDPSRRIDIPQGLAVLDFCDNSNLEMDDLDFGLLDHWSNGDSLMGGSDASLQQLQMLQQQQIQQQQQQLQLQLQQQQQQHLQSHATALGAMPLAGGSAGLVAARNGSLANTSVQDSADIAGMRQRLVKVWTESPWRWEPGRLGTDSGYGEQSNLPVPSGSVSAGQLREGQGRQLDRVVSDRLEPSGRDKILAIVLSTCTNNAIMTRVASSFPSVDLMDSLIHIFLASHQCQVSEWIHFGSFRLNANPPELLACCASAGAALTPNSTLRKFGMALQEAVRVTIPSRFEDNNTKIHDIGLVQALVLGQDIGIWSGNRRKMEIGECHLNIPITMMRYRSRFLRSSYPILPVTAEDSGEELEAKWVKWREQESWKRLIFHCYLRDAQMSLTTLTAPHMSYAELTLPLPESKQLWSAGTAREWQALYLEHTIRENKRPPSLGDLFRNIDLLTQNHHRLDVQFALSIYLHGFWSLIWELRQMTSVHCGSVFSSAASAAAPEHSGFSSSSISMSAGGGSGYDDRGAGLGGSTSLLLGQRRQELGKVLENFRLVTHGWDDLTAQESLVLNLLRMHLHVSLADLQIFSGKEGEEQARAVYPVLQRWADSTESRHALWHAGQILKCARLFPTGHLKDIYAIAVHHAALALWTYGIVKKATGGGSGAPGGSNVSATSSSPVSTGDVVFLDDTESPHVERFIRLGYGRAAIHTQAHQQRQQGGGNAASTVAALLSDPRACMDVAQEVLRANFSDDRDPLPVIVENLCQLLTQLGNAAWAVGEM